MKTRNSWGLLHDYDWKEDSLTVEFERLLSAGLILHKHNSWVAGYVSRRGNGYVARYAGQYGRGFVRVTPSWESTRFCRLSYYLEP